MAHAENVQRWLNCKWHVAFGYADREAEAAMEEGEIKNFGCGKSEVIDIGIKGRRFATNNFRGLDGWLYEVAVLHTGGKLDDPEVAKLLDDACGRCPYFITKYSKLS